MAERTSSGTSRRTRDSGDDESVGQFSIDQEIGKGSFATVYSGRHKTTGHLVAIKAVELARLNKKLKENLYGEIKILKSLRHPHIVALHDCLESRTHINLIMEYCELGDLSLFIKKRDKLITNPATHDIARKYPNVPGSGLNEVVIRHFLKQLASALKFLREANLVHRDVKPQNLLLLPSPQFREATRKSNKRVLSASHDSFTPAVGLASLPMLKLADFGFARVLPSTSLAETLCGSPLYMAPEILRYERYDAKADLWSVGTVLYEMVTGRPPFRAGNHVELLRKIESQEDQIRFPKETVVSSELKSLIRALLKRNPVERISFENFFGHAAVVNPIPGLVEDDVPKEEERRLPKDVRAATKSDESPPIARRPSLRRYGITDNDGREGGAPLSPLSPLSPKPLRSSPLATPIEQKPDPLDRMMNQRESVPQSRYETGEGLGIRRPAVQPVVTAPGRILTQGERRRGLSNASLKTRTRPSSSPTSSAVEERAGTYARSRGGRGGGGGLTEEQEKAAQDVAFERDYVLVEKKHVEVNALADQLDSESPRTGQTTTRRLTQQGLPTSSTTTGAAPSSQSRNLQLAQGRADYRLGSYDKPLASSPASTTTSAISKAIQDASLRLFGFKYPPNLLGKGQSPPHIYSPFPTYPAPAAPLGLIGDGRQTVPLDEDSRVLQCIEDCASRGDVVYWFAEVKYQQLVPLAPSMDHGLGGVPAEKLALDDDDCLTVEAVVALSEEALVLYVKALSLLAKSMDIASLWWSRKNRIESGNGGHTSSSQSLKINSAVQWIRGRFNDVLGKAEIVRLKLLEAQKQLPEDHPSHPSNHPEQASASASSAEGVFLSPGISAEKLMYDRALEMSRAAAINELASEDLKGCELSYKTAILMLEAVLDNEEDLPKRVISGSSGDERVPVPDEISSDMNSDDQQAVHKVIQMVTGRRALVIKKLQMIETAEKAQQQQQQQQQSGIPARRRSGDITPRSLPAS